MDKTLIADLGHISYYSIALKNELLLDKPIPQIYLLRLVELTEKVNSKLKIVSSVCNCEVCQSKR